MTVEERVTKLEENMLVQSELLARFERRTEAWMEQTQEWIEQAEARMTQFEAVSTAVLERVDRFIQGREGNGQRP
jgi:hypothetical protein